MFSIMSIDYFVYNLGLISSFLQLKTFCKLVNSSVVFSTIHNNFFWNHKNFYFISILFPDLGKEVLCLPNFKYEYLYLYFTL